MMRMRTFFFGALVGVLSLQSGLAHAQLDGEDRTTSSSCGSSSGLINPLKVCSFDDLLRAILNGVIEIGTIVLILMLVYVGFLFVMARGNPQQITSAKQALLWTVIGGLVLLGATAIQVVISGTVESIRI